MKYVIFILMAVLMVACANNKVFRPKSGYPPDPWVKGYSNPDDCIGGEQLAARAFKLPDYPSRAFRSGRQGWVIMRLDVSRQGLPENVSVERSVPDGLFEGASRKAVKNWLFEPPKVGRMENCRVLFRFRAGDVTLGG